MKYRTNYRMLALVVAMAFIVVSLFRLADLHIFSTQPTTGKNPRQRFGHSQSFKGRLEIPPVSELQKLNRAVLEDFYHRYVENIQVVCKEQIHYGLEGDGGYYYCRDVNLKPPCMMYSFGTRNDYSFDDEIAYEVGCDVHSVDPGDGQKDHKRSERVWFHKLGLGGQTRTLENLNWKIYSLPDIRKLLHHENRTLDILKIDTEMMIWETLDDIARPHVIDDVRLLMVELHINIADKPVQEWSRSKEDYIQHLNCLRKLIGLSDSTLVYRTLDILKIDTEMMIWETLDDIARPHVIDDVRLLMVELHINIADKPVQEWSRSKEDYIQHLNCLRKLYDIGFRIYYFHKWHICEIDDDVGNRRTGCHDVHFIHKKWTSPV